MKPRSLLLGVSLLCLLLLFPAAALSQGTTVNAGCGTATIDGNVGAREWANAGTVPLYEGYWLDAAGDSAGLSFEGVAPSQVEIGQALFMNDGQYLYVGAILNDPEHVVPEAHPVFDVHMGFAFEDEPAGDPAAWVDCTWEAASCQQVVDEGALYGTTVREMGEEDAEDHVSFSQWAYEHDPCLDSPPFTGVTYRGLPQGDVAHMEMRVDLDTSPLNNPDPAGGDCFDLRWMSVRFEGGFPPPGEWGSVEARWPYEPVDYEPYDGECTILCLNPCQVEFVPEPGTILLLGGGLMGLAGYAGLRWRSRE